MVAQTATDAPPGTVRHNSRGLCTGCRDHVARHGDLADYQRLTRSLDDTVTDYQVLRQRGLDHQEIAENFGVKPASLQRALERARARGRTTCWRTTRTSSTSEEYVLWRIRLEGTEADITAAAAPKPQTEGPQW